LVVSVHTLTKRRDILERKGEPRVTESFNTLDEREARERLSSCLAVPRWVTVVLEGRPYESVRDLLEEAEAAARTLTEQEVDGALARHPRIGEAPGAGHDAEFSSREQAAVGAGSATVADQLKVANAEYERRFDRVFLVRAAGRTSEEILAELRRRMSNDRATELTETVDQLAEIAVGRLEQVIRR
jgi:OHCU decarboxylase